MDRHPIHFYTSEMLFRPGEDIFINRTCEQVDTSLHSHDFVEIAYVASGRGTHQIGGREYAVSKGDLFIINYNVMHAFRSLPGAGEPRLMLYNCIFQPRFIDYSFMNCRDFSDIMHHFLFRSLFPGEDKNEADIKLLAHDSREIEEIYEKMYREYQIQEQGYIEILRAYVIELLVMIFRKYRSSTPLEDGLEYTRKQIVEKAVRFMKQNYAQEMKLEDLSLMTFLSRSHFCRLFKEATGMTVSEYTQKIRIDEACQLLKKTDKKVIEIAGAVGYSDLKFFNQVFKRFTGKTPGEYRRSLSASPSWILPSLFEYTIREDGK